MSTATPKEYSAEEIRSLHGEEAGNLGWRMTFTEGQVKGDLDVSILPPPSMVSGGAKSRVYHYRRNSLTGKFTLVLRN